MSSLGGEHDEHPAGHPAGAMDEDIPGGPGHDLRDDPGGCEQGHGQERRFTPAQGRWLCSDMRLRGEEPLRPGTLEAKRRAVDEHLVTHGKPADAGPIARTTPAGLDAERHRWPDPDIPGAGPDEIVPVADA